MSEDLIARLREQFDEGALIELTALAIAFQNLSSKFHRQRRILGSSTLLYGAFPG
ncbi:MAG: hypothetical protein MZV65_42630 [Chromatiales bacterium]|nr:hypothetical protein [Chromatiales bacterium]